MANPTTRAELITHCLRRLGEPVLEVNVDEDQLEELYEYFIDSNSDSIEEAVTSFEGDYEEEELRLYRLKFMSEIAN